MVEWTDAKRTAISTLWSNIDVGEIGPQALSRLLVVFPWTQRYSTTFGDLSTPAAIAANPKVAHHGKAVMGGLEIAVKNLDNIKNVYAKLSMMNSEKLNVDQLQAHLWRALIVYPWIERYFGTFGDIFTTTAILNNPKLAAHGKVVLVAVDSAVKNIENFKGMFSALSKQNYERIKVDPDNFRLLAECITITIACKLKAELNRQVQGTWQKFLSAVVEAMSSQYK